MTPAMKQTVPGLPGEGPTGPSPCTASERTLRGPGGSEPSWAGGWAAAGAASAAPRRRGWRGREKAPTLPATEFSASEPKLSANTRPC